MDKNEEMVQIKRTELEEFTNMFKTLLKEKEELTARVDFLEVEKKVNVIPTTSLRELMEKIKKFGSN